jgi:hypothetical protein
VKSPYCPHFLPAMTRSSVSEPMSSDARFMHIGG